MRIFAFIAVIAVSASGWGAFYYYMSEVRPAEQQKMAGRILAELEYKWKFQDSLKQEEEMQKRNVLFVRQREFERQVEEEAGKQRSAFAQMNEEYRQKADEAFRQLNDSLKAELEKAEALSQAQAKKQSEESRVLLDQIKADVKASLDQLAAAESRESQARAKEAAAFAAARQKDRQRMAAFDARVRELETRLERLQERLAEATARPAQADEPKPVPAPVVTEGGAK